MRKLHIGVLAFLLIVVPSCVFASTIYETVEWITGTEDMVLDFTTETEPYTMVATLTDLSVDPYFGFEFLFLSITTASELVDSIVVAPYGQGSITFDVTAGEKWFANIFGIGGGTMNTGLLGLKIESVPGVVPIPPAFLLFGSGMVALVAYRKRSRR